MHIEYKERDEEKRKKYFQELEKIPKENRVYLDESGIDQYLRRRHARSTRRLKVYGMISGLRYSRESFIAGKIGSKILAPFCYKGTCDTTLFNI